MVTKTTSKSNNDIKVAAVCFSHSRLQQAQTFCALHSLPLLKTKDSDHDLQLLFHDDLVELYDTSLDTTISIDFIHGAMAHRHQYGGGRGQAIAKAVGLRSGATPSVLDVTAGLAGDAFVLATLGCSLTLIERSPVIFCLIQDAINRASLNDSFQPVLEHGFVAINCDSVDYLTGRLEADDDKSSAPDVIYIDPMYPERKKSALVKKDMQILQRLHGADGGQVELMDKAMEYARKRVVVKRPIHAETITGRKPNTYIKSKKTRFDIYTKEKMR